MEESKIQEKKPLLMERQYSELISAKTNNTRMYLCCVVVYFGSFATGTMLGLSSPMIPDIEASKAKDTPHLNFMNASWFGSLLNVGGIVGGIVAGYIMQSLGRKLTTTISAVPFIVGLLFVTFANRVWLLYVGRVISGLSVGTSLLLIPVYVGEIAPPSVRGMLGSANQLVITIGVLAIFELGNVLPWRWLAVAAMALPALLFIFSFSLLETPRFLMLQHHPEKAKENLQRLRGRDADIEHEYKELEENLRSDVKSASWGEILKTKGLRTPTLLSIGVMYFQKFSGIPFVMFYAKPVFMEAGFKNGSLELSLALLSVSGFQVLFTLLSSLIVDKTGRKVLLIISGVFMSLSLTVLGLYFHILRDDIVSSTKLHPTLSNTQFLNATTSPTTITSYETDSGLKYMPLVSLSAFMAAYSIGFGPIAWLLMGEIIPVRARGNSAGVSTAFNLLLVFLVTSVFSTMMKTLTPEGTFWFFAANNALSVVFIALFLPETKGKSLEEIETYFQHN